MWKDVTRAIRKNNNQKKFRITNFVIFSSCFFYSKFCSNTKRQYFDIPILIPGGSTAGELLMIPNYIALLDNSQPNVEEFDEIESWRMTVLILPQAPRQQFCTLSWFASLAIDNLTSDTYIRPYVQANKCIPEKEKGWAFGVGLLPHLSVSIKKEKKKKVRTCKG